MPTETRSRDLCARSAAIVDHHYDTSNPHKPLWLLIPSGLVALLLLTAAILMAYQVWYARAVPASEGTVWIALLMGAYLAAVFLFSYGYEMYDVPRALRTTAIIGVCGLSIVVVLAVIFYVLSDSDIDFSFSGSSGGSSNAGKKVVDTGMRFVGNTALNSVPDVVANSANSAVATLHSTATTIFHTDKDSCSYCARPLPPGGAQPNPGADPNKFCPQCGQRFVPTGEAARALMTGEAARGLIQANCRACGVFGPVRSDGTCELCAGKQKATAAASS